MANWLNEQCKLKVQVAEHGQRIRPGYVYIAPESHHMSLFSEDEIGLIRNPPFPVQFKPSVDVLFSSAAQVLGNHAVGVLLSGMGTDGSKGLLELYQAGARTIAQDEASSIVFGMPGAAVAINAVQELLSSAEIGKRIAELANRAGG